MATAFTYKNNNSVEDGGAFFITPGTITVGADAFIYNFTSNLGPSNYNAGLVLFGGSYAVTVNGIIGTAYTLASGNGIEFNGGVGTSKLTVGASGEIFGGHTAVAAFHPTNIVNAGQIEGATNGIFEGGDGNWSITNNKDGEISSLNNAIYINGLGVHTISNAGLIFADPLEHAVWAAGDGAEKLTNSGRILGIVALGDGNDVFVNTGFVGEDVIFGDGANSFTNNGTVGAAPVSVEFGVDSDSFTNSGNMYGDVDFGAGKNIYTNSGLQRGDVEFGDGDDTFTNKGKLEQFAPGDALSFGNGNNVFTNSGTVGTEEAPFAVLFGSGNDKFTNTGTLHAYLIVLGAGNDTYIGGNGVDTIFDEAGNDTYQLGGGDDLFYANGLGSGGDIDTVDGGAGLYDHFDAGDSIADLIINLDATNHFDQYYSVTAIGKMATDGGLGDIGVNKISNFEGVTAGDGDDVVFGTAGSNFILGGAGDDDLFGLGGNDYIQGGDHDDYLVGGAGKDNLTGGAGADRFIYTDLKDSTSSISGRDLITDFEDGTDKIDLSGIILKGGAAHFVGTNTRFGDGQVGDVRAMITGAGWQIQMDAQKDGVADFVIEVTDINHAIVWSNTDFLFS